MIFFPVISPNLSSIHYYISSISSGYYPDVCPAGQYRTKDETCFDCPLGSWSAEGATKCRDCDEGQYDVDHLYCSDCPPGTFSFKNCKDEKKNKCRPCGKGKVSENKIKQKMFYWQLTINPIETTLAFDSDLISTVWRLPISCAGLYLFNIYLSVRPS